MEQISIQSGARPRERPCAVYADKAYHSDAIRKHLASRGIRSRIARRIWKAKKGNKETGTRYEGEVIC
ncbi:MAG: hypothetical protein QW177_09730 [Candidatus Nitrosotenuis sp.]